MRQRLSDNLMNANSRFDPSETNGGKADGLTDLAACRDRLRQEVERFHNLLTEVRAALEGITKLIEPIKMKLAGDDDVGRLSRTTRDLLGAIDRQLWPSRPNAERLSDAPLSSANVLYIEDDAMNFALVAHTLRQRPAIKVTQATSGETGLALAETQNPNLILLDLNLPGVHGSEVLSRLRQNSATSQIPVVILSADATPSQIERLLSAGARNYITKPFDLDTFLAVIDEALEKPTPSS
jgi:CheY-like chemotaxis protein